MGLRGSPVVSTWMRDCGGPGFIPSSEDGKSQLKRHGALTCKHMWIHPHIMDFQNETCTNDIDPNNESMDIHGREQ